MGIVSDALTGLSDAVGLKEPLDDFADSVGDVVRNNELARVALIAAAAYFAAPYVSQLLGAGTGAAATATEGLSFAAADAASMASMGLSEAAIAQNLAAAGMTQQGAIIAAQNAAMGLTGDALVGSLVEAGNNMLVSGAVQSTITNPAVAAQYAADLQAFGLSPEAISSELVTSGIDPMIASSMASDIAMGATPAELSQTWATGTGGSSSGGLMDTIAKTAGDKLKDPATWQSTLNNLANVAGGAYLADKSSSLFSDLARQSKQVATDAAGRITKAGEDAASKASFKPYTVTSGLGGTSVTPEGLSYNLSPQQQAITDSLMSQAQNMASQDAYVSPEGLFSTLQAMSDPVNARTRLAMENRLSAQGRLGTATAAYGGTPEQLAMEIAMQEQLAKNAWQSQIGAGQLTSQNLTNQGAALGTAYKPYDQMQGMMSQALSGQALAQSVANNQAQLGYDSAIDASKALLLGDKNYLDYIAAANRNSLAAQQALLGQGAKGTNNLVNTASGLFDLGKSVWDWAKK